MYRKNLNINRREYTLLHLQWGFVYMLQIDKLHPKMHIFDPIEN